jgi:hypothetical protein
MAAPTLVTITNDTGTSGTDLITSDTGLIFAGTADAGSVVDVFVNGESAGFGVADGGGSWTIDLASNLFNFSQGTFLIQIRANLQFSSDYNLTVDTAAPVAPSAPDLASASDSGASATDNITDDDTPTLNGTTEANSIVEIFDGVASLGTVAANGSGNWSFTTGSLSDGAHTLTAKATDIAGNVSAASAALAITVDTAAAAPVISTTISVDTGGSSTDRVTSDNTVALTGTAEAGATVSILEGVTLLGTALADGLGAWSFTTAALPDGVKSFTATQTDVAGNVSAASAPVTATIDTVAPSVPVVSSTITVDSGSSNSDRITNDNTVTFTGTADLNRGVLIFEGATFLGSVLADGAGNWSITTSALADGVHTVHAISRDLAGNNSAASPTLAVTIDTAAQTPSAPLLVAGSDTGSSLTDNITSDTTPTLTGTAEAGNVIQIFDGVTLLGTTTANGSGNWTFTPAALLDGPYSLTAVATDTAGNVSAASGALAVTIDTTAPAAPSTPDLATASDSGSSSVDNLTNDTTPTLNGTAVAGSKIEIFDGVTSLGTTTADGGGAWSFTTGALSSGGHTLTAQATDVAGNVGAASAGLAITIDTAAPSSTVTAIDQDTGTSATDEITRDRTLFIEGTAEANARVDVFLGGGLIGSTTADGLGDWSFDYTGTSLADGTYQFTSKATDAAGNTGAESAALTVIVDNVAPPTDAVATAIVTDTGASNSDGITNDTTVVINGTAEANAIVEVFLDAVSQGTVLANGSGAWSYTPGALPEGTYTVTALVSDAAGNLRLSSTPFNFTIDTTAPAAPSAPDLQAGSDTGTSPTDNITGDNTPTLTGTATAGITVEIFDGVTSLGTTTADGGGAWSFTAGTLSDGAHTLTARTVDVAGNPSAPSAGLVVTIDATAPAAPIVTGITTDSGASNTDGITNDPTLLINGTAEANALIQVFDGVSLLGTTTASGGGVWSFDYTGTVLAPGAYAITAKAIDTAGNTSASSNTFGVTVDIAAVTPSVPDLAAGSDLGASATDNITSDNTPTFTGTAEAGSRVEIFDGIASLGTVAADGSGNWSFTSAIMTDGGHSLTAQITDLAGNVSAASAALAITVDTVAPVAAPSAPDLVAGSDSGSSNSDNITNDTTPTLTGTATAGSTVQLFDGVTSLGTTTADGGGLWSFTTGVLPAGPHSITARETDLAGNTGPASPALVVTIDATAPAAPVVTGITTDTGASGSDRITSDTTLVIAGTAEANSVVQVFDGVTPLGTTTANGSGIWSFDHTGTALTAGAHSLTAVATDAAGNASVASAAFAVTVDTTAAAPSVPDLAAASDSGASDTDNITSDTTPTVTGTAEAGSIVEVFDGVTSLGTTTADGSGNWSFTSAVLTDGVHNLNARMTDLAGNVSAVSASLAITIDSAAPAAPSAPDLVAASDSGSSNSDNLTNDTTPTLTGTATAGITVEVLDGVTLLGTTTTDGSGNWTFTTAVLTEGAHSLTARTRDTAGNVSAASAALALTIDTTAPAVPSTPDLDAASDTGSDPTDNITNDTTPTLNGTAVAGSIVEIFDGVTSLGTALADGGGAWTFTAGTLALGVHNLTARAIDPAGNASAASAALAVDIQGGVTINGTAGVDIVNATKTPVGQPLPTNLNDTINGLGGNDNLSGLGGDDTIDGGTGADKMIGGGGNDTYIVDNAGDKITEKANEGVDQVFASVTHTLGGQVDNLALTGVANINGTGNGLANTIVGNGSDNKLNGAGGNDRLEGGGGNDTLNDKAGFDTFVFAGNFGNDTVIGFVGKGAAQGDTIEFDDAIFANFAAVLAATTDLGNDLLITHANGTVTLKAVKDVSLLDASDFTFV